MNAEAKADAVSGVEEKASRKKTERARGACRFTGPGKQKGSRDASRKAAVILEVLAGARTPTQAAEAMGVSANRYYQVESRALQGLVEACEPRPKGSGVSPERELAKLRREVDKLRSVSTRYQALARATQRAVGIAPPKTKPAKDGRKRRRRRPSVRALKVAEGLRTSVESAKEPEALAAAKIPS